MKVYYILVHMCFAPMDLPVYDCNSFYWPEQFTLNNCVKMLPTKKDEIEQQFKKNNLRILKMKINCVKPNTIAS